jgi:hypothetical protein
MGAFVATIREMISRGSWFDGAGTRYGSAGDWGCGQPVAGVAREQKGRRKRP